MIAETGKNRASERRDRWRSLVLPLEEFSRIESEVTGAYPEECCGILLGQAGSESGIERTVSRAVPVKNEYLGDRRRGYKIAPETLLGVFKGARVDGEVIIGFYHSHPDGSATPSRIDLKTDWPGIGQVIVAVRGEWVTGMRCWRVSASESLPEEIQILIAEEFES